MRYHHHHHYQKSNCQPVWPRTLSHSGLLIVANIVKEGDDQQTTGVPSRQKDKQNKQDKQDKQDKDQSLITHHPLLTTLPRLQKRTEHLFCGCHTLEKVMDLRRMVETWWQHNKCTSST